MISKKNITQQTSVFDSLKQYHLDSNLELMLIKTKDGKSFAIAYTNSYDGGVSIIQVYNSKIEEIINGNK